MILIMPLPEKQPKKRGESFSESGYNKSIKESDKE